MSPSRRSQKAHSMRKSSKAASVSTCGETSIKMVIVPQMKLLAQHGLPSNVSLSYPTPAVPLQHATLPASTVTTDQQSIALPRAIRKELDDMHARSAETITIIKRLKNSLRIERSERELDIEKHNVCLNVLSDFVNVTSVCGGSDAYNDDTASGQVFRDLFSSTVPYVDSYQQAQLYESVLQADPA